MSIAIASTLLTIIGIAYAVLLKRKLAETFFLAIVSVILVLYLFGLLNTVGSLLLGIYFIIAMTGVCLLFLIYEVLKDKTILLETQVPQGCIMILSAIAFSLYVNLGRGLASWDEFTHWGSIVKTFFVYDALGTIGLATGYGVIGFAGNPPGTSLFNYFFIRFSSEFYEYPLFVAMNILYFSMIMPVIKDIFTKKHVLKQGVILFILVVIPAHSNFVYLYITLLTDGVLGTLFGISFLYYFIYKYEKSIYGLLITTAAIFMLALTKDTGFFLALGVIGVISADMVLFRRRQIMDFISSQKNVAAKIKNITLLFLPLITVLFFRFSWSTLFSRAGRAMPVSGVPNAITISDILALFTGQLTQGQREVRWYFVFQGMLNRSIFRLEAINLDVTFAISCLLFSILVIAIAYCKNRDFNFVRMVSISALVLAGAFIYQFMLLLTYVYLFYPRDIAFRICSYERYTHSYILGMKIFLIAFFVMRDDGQHSKQKPLREYLSISGDILSIKYMSLYRDFFLSEKKGFLFIIAIFLLANLHLAGFSTVLLSRIYTPNFTARPTLIAADYWRERLEDKSVNLIAQDDNGYLFWVLHYELFPNASIRNEFVRSRSSNIASEYCEYNPSALIISSDEWGEFVIANNFDVVWVYRYNDSFINDFGHFFPYGVQDNMVYEVMIIDDGLSLIPLG